MKSPRLMLVKSTEMRLVAAKGRQPNAAYRVREHLTESLSRSFMSGALRIEAHRSTLFWCLDTVIGLCSVDEALRTRGLDVA
jgi:hypothetical protein